MPGIKIAFDLPYALYLQPGHIFTVPLEQSLFKVHFEDKRFTEVTRFGRATNWELKNDKSGTFRYTRIYIEFDSATPLEHAEAIEYAHRAANRIIEVYRHITNRAYLEPVRSHQVLNPLVFLEQPNGEWAASQSITMPKGAGLARPYDSAEINAQVSDWLGMSRVIKLNEVLLLNAKDRLESEDYRPALVESLSAVEVFTDQYLRAGYRTWGWPDIRIAKHLIDGRNWQITDRLKKLVQEVSGRNVSWNADVWQPWHDAKRLRDKVVHAGLVLDYKDQPKVSAAIESCEKLIEYISGLSYRVQDHA